MDFTAPYYNTNFPTIYPSYPHHQYPTNVPSDSAKSPPSSMPYMTNIPPMVQPVIDSNSNLHDNTNNSGISRTIYPSYSYPPTSSTPSSQHYFLTSSMPQSSSSTTITTTTTVNPSPLVSLSLSLSYYYPNLPTTTSEPCYPEPVPMNRPNIPVEHVPPIKVEPGLTAEIAAGIPPIKQEKQPLLPPVPAVVEPLPQSVIKTHTQEAHQQPSWIESLLKENGSNILDDVKTDLASPLITTPAANIQTASTGFLNEVNPIDRRGVLAAHHLHCKRIKYDHWLRAFEAEEAAQEATESVKIGQKRSRGTDVTIVKLNEPNILRMSMYQKMAIHFQHFYNDHNIYSMSSLLLYSLCHEDVTRKTVFLGTSSISNTTPTLSTPITTPPLSRSTSLSSSSNSSQYSSPTSYYHQQNVPSGHHTGSDIDTTPIHSIELTGAHTILHSFDYIFQKLPDSVLIINELKLINKDDHDDPTSSTSACSSSSDGVVCLVPYTYLFKMPIVVSNDIDNCAINNSLSNSSSSSCVTPSPCSSIDLSITSLGNRENDSISILKHSLFEDDHDIHISPRDYDHHHRIDTNNFPIIDDEIHNPTVKMIEIELQGHMELNFSDNDNRIVSIIDHSSLIHKSTNNNPITSMEEIIRYMGYI